MELMASGQTTANNTSYTIKGGIMSTIIERRRRCQKSESCIRRVINDLKKDTFLKLMALFMVWFMLYAFFGVMIPQFREEQKWMNGEVDGHVRIKVRTPGLFQRTEILTM